MNQVAFKKYMLTSTGGKHLEEPCSKCGKYALSLHVTDDRDFYCRACKENIESTELHSNVVAVAVEGN